MHSYLYTEICNTKNSINPEPAKKNQSSPIPIPYQKHIHIENLNNRLNKNVYAILTKKNHLLFRAVYGQFINVYSNLG